MKGPFYYCGWNEKRNSPEVDIIREHADDFPTVIIPLFVHEVDANAQYSCVKKVTIVEAKNEVGGKDDHRRT